MRTRQNIFWLLAILGLCAALFRPSPPKPAAAQPTLAPPPEPIASASPNIGLPPEADCPLCHTNSGVKPIQTLLSSCVIAPLDDKRKERNWALSQGMHVDHRSFMGLGRAAAWFCQSCKCHFQWRDILVESPAPPAELSPSQDCSDCDSDEKWARWELNTKKWLDDEDERAAAREQVYQSSRAHKAQGPMKSTHTPTE